MRFKKAIAIVFAVCAAALFCGCGSAGYNTDAASVDGLEITDGVSADVTTEREEVDAIMAALADTGVSSPRVDGSSGWPYHVRIFNSDGSIQLVELDDGHIHYDGKTYNARTGKIIAAVDSALS